MSASREMPKYKCHKKVWALKIKEVQDNKATNPTLAFEEDGYAPIPVDWDWYYKHKPHPGGYYVVYEDGYKSFSPAAAFESGYKPLRQERDQLKAELADARSCAKALEQEMNRARADERQAMHYLEQIRKAVAPDVDFPTLVRMCGELQAQTVDTLIDMSEGATIHQWRIAAKSYANQLRAKASEA